jgi:serine protease
MSRCSWFTITVADSQVVRLSLVVLLAVALAACRTGPEPELSVAPTSLVVTTTNSNEFLVSNVGSPESVLTFEAVTDPDASWLTVSPRDGILDAGSTSAITVRIATGSQPEAGKRGSVEVRSNAGTAIVDVMVGDPRGSSVCARDPSLLGDDLELPSLGRFAAPIVPLGVTIPRSETIDEFLVLYHPAETSRAGSVGRAGLGDDVARAVGAEVVRRGVHTQHDLVRLPADAPEAAVEALRRDPRVAAVAPNLPVHRLATPNDPWFTAQWWAWCFGAREAWNLVTGSAADTQDDVVVAVIDDGIYVHHTDLAGKLLPGYDFAERNETVTTESTHGTHVAGIALAAGDNGTAIAGIAYGERIRLLPAKVFPDDVNVNGSLDYVVNAMRWAVGLPVTDTPENPFPADVINLSLGIGTLATDPTIAFLEAVVAEVRSTGAVVVAAAGNGGQSTGVEYPARTNGVIAVGAVDWSGLRSTFSTHGQGLDIMAPGGLAYPAVASACQYVLSLGVDTPNALACMAGTSMATPFVSGAIALLIAHDDRFRARPDLVEERLFASTLWDDTMTKATYGSGIACTDALLLAGTRCGWPEPE